MLVQNNTKNAYLVARLQSLRTEFLDTKDFERMIEAKNIEEAWQVLNDSVYAQYFSAAKGPKDFDLVLNKSLKETKAEILSLYTPARDLKFLWIKYDFLNIKSLLKAKFSHSEPRLNFLGEIPVEKLKEVILEGVQKTLPFGLDQVIAAAIAHFEKENDPQALDFFCDQKYLEIFGREIRKIRSKGLLGFLRREIDLFNVKTSLRFRGQETDRAAYIAGGFIPLRRFQEQQEQNLMEDVFDLQERDLLRHFEEQKEKEGGVALEREARRVLLGLIATMEGKILGIEPVFAFWQLKVLEVKMIHRILTLKNAGIDPSKIHALVGI